MQRDQDHSFSQRPSCSLVNLDSQPPNHPPSDLFQNLADSLHHPQSNPPQSQFQPPSSLSPTRCKCSKIGCLKLYCQCFTRGTLCSKQCTCMGCQNCRGNQKRILVAQQMANFRKPGSFFGITSYVPDKKCTCKKSHCQKKYCECHSAGIACGPACQCVECYNREGEGNGEKKEEEEKWKVGVGIGGVGA